MRPRLLLAALVACGLIVAAVVRSDRSSPPRRPRPVTLASRPIARLAGAGEYLNVALSYAGDGSVVAAWIRLRSADSRVESVSLPSGAARWTATEVLASPAGAVADLRLVRGVDGSLAASWRADGTGHDEAFVALWSGGGGGWGRPTRVEGVPAAGSFQLAATTTRLTGAWSDGRRVVTAVLQAGREAWSHPLVAARLPAGHEAHDLQLLVSLDGRAVVAWIDRQDGVGTAVRAARLGAARPTVSTIAVAHRGRVGLDGLIAVGNAAGRATLVWRDRSNGAHLRSATLAGWNQRWAVADGPAGVDVTDAFRGVLSADLTGTVTGAWRVGRQVVVALRDAHGGWTRLTDLATGTDEPADERLGIEPSVAVGASGSAIAAWAVRAGLLGTAIRVRTRSPGQSAWAGGARIPVGPRRRTPIVAVAPDGRTATIIWQDNAGTRFGPFVDAATVAIESLRLRMP